eukprot:gb/GECG01007316.1/.p1 GENE.gb/GECG01007316.1/~~gb/GECG01007316.1/.p1  ORF type:complete len:145 (+),score=24.84 gb/GECG01007316.1/:1-435(+)
MEKEETKQMGQSILYLQSREGSVYEISREAALMNGLLEMMLDDEEDSSGAEEETCESPSANKSLDTKSVVPLPELSDNILRKVVDWCKYHSSEPVSFLTDDEGNKFANNRWDNEFLNVDKHTLFDLQLVSHRLVLNYLVSMQLC